MFYFQADHFVLDNQLWERNIFIKETVTTRAKSDKNTSYKYGAWVRSLIVNRGKSFKKDKTHRSAVIRKTDRDLSGQTKWPWWWVVKQGWCAEDSFLNPKRSSANHPHASTSSWEQSSQLSARYQWVLRQFYFNCWDEIVWEISDKESLNKDERPCLKRVLKMCYLQNRIWCEINARGLNSQKWFWQAEMTSLRVGWHWNYSQESFQGSLCIFFSVFSVFKK